MALGEHVLQHAGVVLAGSVGALFDERARIAMKLDAEGFCDGFALGDEGVEKCARGRQAGGSAVVQQSERANGIGGGVEDELGPLRAARVSERDDMHAAAIEESGKFFDEFERSVGGFERTDPGVAANVETNVAGFDEMAGGKRGTANDVFDVVGEDFFVADSILDGADGAGGAEEVLCLLDGKARVSAFGGHDAEIAKGNL